ncbi:MAG TPA: hypothetical protein VFY24_02055, partial [Azospira sp.]|nr:hypothetical protein [Azospira sp.]
LSSPLTPGRERSGFERVFAALIADAQAQGGIAATPPAAQLAHYLQFLHLGALVRWLDAGGEADGRLAAEFSAMLDLFLHGVGGAER